MKICPVGAEFHADGQTDMTKLILAFRNFANAPKMTLHLNVKIIRVRKMNTCHCNNLLRPELEDCPREELGLFRQHGSPVLKQNEHQSYRLSDYTMPQFSWISKNLECLNISCSCLLTLSISTPYIRYTICIAVPWSHFFIRYHWNTKSAEISQSFFCRFEPWWRNMTFSSICINCVHWRHSRTFAISRTRNRYFTIYCTCSYIPDV
jgi:hypothetical protein